MMIFCFIQTVLPEKAKLRMYEPLVDFDLWLCCVVLFLRQDPM